MARRKTAAKTKSTTTKKKNGSAIKNTKNDDEKVKDNQKNKSVTITTSKNNNSSGGGTTTIMDESNIKSTKLLKSTTTEKLQLHLLNNIDIKNMTNHNHNNNSKNYNNQQQKNNTTTTTATTTSSSTIIDSLYGTTTGPPLSSTQTTDNLIHRSSNNSISSTLLEPKNNNSNNLNNNIDKSNNNNREILISKINCQSTNNNNDKYLHKKFKRPASVTVIENNNNNNYLNINSPIPITNSTTTNLTNEQNQNNQHHLSIDSIGGCNVSGTVSDGNCNNSNNNIGVKENIDDDNFKNPINNLISKSFTSSDKHLICENIINNNHNNNNSNYIGENGHDIIDNQKINNNCNNIDSDTEYQQKQNNNLISKINNSDLIINNKKPIINSLLSKSTTIVNENLIQKHNHLTTEKSIIIKKPKIKQHYIKGSLYSGPSENSSIPIDIQQQQQLNENLDFNYIGKQQSLKRLTTIKNLPSGSTDFHKQTNDIFKIVNNNNNSNNINNKNIINSTISPTISNNMHNSTNFNVINNNQKLDKKDKDQQQQQQINSTTPTILAGRHVCPYCNLNCTKPSVLQKHIRAHTNERPYPCDKCGIAFKTNSNYYKHCRSRSHLQRMKGVVDPQPNDDDGSLGSDQDPDLSNSSSDVISGTTSPLDERISSPAVQQLHHNQHYQHHHNQQNQLSSASSISSNSSTSSSIQKNSNDKPYKPKFHNAALYKDENIIATTTSIYRPRHNQPQPQPPQQQQQSSLSPYSNKQNQMTNLSATSNLHNINNHISETLSSNYYSAQSQFIQQQQQQEQQQILHNHSTYIHPSGINHHEQQQKHHRSQISVNCESAMVVGSSTIPHHQQQHYTQQISSSAFQQSVAPVYNPETTGIITTIPLVVRDSTGSSSNFGGGSNSGGSLATATTGGGHQLNVEFLQEHISKLISQNQAIVENKEVLLQKKYPKQLNKQKSLSSLVIPTSSSIIETAGNSSSVTTPLNSKLHLALANKQQHQQQQQSHQHHHQQQLQLLFQQREEMLNRNSQNMNGFLTITNNTIPSPAPAPRPHCSTSNKNLTHQISEPSISSQQPLNLSKVSVVVDPTEIINSTPSPPLALTSVKQSSGCRKRSADDILLSSNSNTPTKTLATHPQNPERSIIKHLLLNARGLGIPNGEGDDAVYTCPLCKSDFQNAEELKHHTSHYCQGGPSSAPISPVASPSYKYFRSNSINVNLPEFNNPTSLATLAKSSLLHGKNPLPLAKLAFYRLKTKQSNLILNQLNVSTGNSTNNTTITSANIKNDNNNSETMQKLIDAPLPSPGPLLGKTQLVESYNPASNSDHKSEDVIITKVHEERNFPSTSNKEFYNAKKIKYDNQHISHNNYTPAHGQTFFGGGNMFESQSTQKTQFLMCNSGGDIQIIDKKDNNNVMKRFMSSGGCIEPISESITSPKFFRTPLLSGGSFTEIISQENQHSQQQQQHKKHETNHQLSIQQQHIKPKMMIPITPLTPSLSSTPNILSAGRGLSLSGQHFQFPPINSITGFNPLTLPPINSISHSPVLPNGEKLIPYVPGIPGPNTLSLQLPPPPQRLIDFTSGSKRNSSPNRIKTTSPMVQESKTSDEQQNYHYRNSIQKYQQQTPIIRIENIEISCTTSSSILQMPQNDLIIGNSSNLRSVDELLPQQQMQRSPKIGSVWISNTHVEPQQQQPLHRKSFNFTRMADNISPKKPEKINLIKSSIPVKEQARHFNFENLSIIKTEIKTEDLQPLHVDCPSSNVPLTTVPSSSSLSKSSLLEPLLPSLQQSPQNPDDKLLSTPSATTAKRTKFLRPTSLPLKPGTFTPKRHHGITPTANTMPLISPETPRPSKTCGQMFLNGHAYTYLGLKCSTKMFYCTVNCPQPSYVANLHKLSMYSVWQVQAEKNLHPLGLKPKTVMALYDSRQRNCTGFSMANIKLPYTSVHSQHTVMTPFENNTGQFYHHQIKSIPLPQITTTTLSSSHQEQTNIPNVVSSTNNSVVKDNQKGPILVGGYESNEDYTYIRGRGRGKYVCAECGIRCKKPSMLVKHIRTHSDIRPYTCSTCNFSFKTKGNLTKHMQSKAHYKRCLELGVDPGEGLNGEFVDNDQQSIISGNDRTSSIPGESDSEYGSDGDDRETESSDTDESKSRLPEHEAAHCLLSLSMTPPSNSVSPHYRSSSQVNYDNDKQQHQQTINSNNTSHRLDELKNQQQNINARRVISFTSPKPPFDYQKQEKYYSNPLVVPKNRPIEKFDENIMKPIDLTKPRCSTQQQLPIVQQLLESSNTTKQLTVRNLNDNNSKITDVIGNLSNESVFHKSLLSITDKIRIGGNNNTDSIEFTGQQHHHPQKQNDDILFQAYLTEQALQYTKIKQSQMSSSKSFNSDDMIKTTNIGLIVTTTTTATTSILAGNLNNYNKIMKKDNINSKSPNLTTITDTTITTQSSNSSIVSTTSSNLTNKLLSGDKLENNENDSILLTDQSSIKEVALDMPRITDSPIIPIINEILTDSNSKLNNINTNTKDVNESNIKLTNENSQLIRTSSISKQKDNAKSVASEYLKITQKTNTNSNNNSVKLQNDETNPDDEDSSDQEIPLSTTTINTTNTTTTTTTDTSNLKPSNDFSGILARTVIVGEDGFKNSTTPTDNQKLFNRVQISDDNGRPICTICSKTFQKQHQLVLHMNIHYMERKFKCEPCAVSFRTQGHLQKHERSEAHKNKVMMTSTFGVPTTSNPRPYECADCKVAFRIHGHLAKHLRSKTHVQKLECSQKLPFGTYAEIERAGISLTEIDTTDCDNSLASLKILAQKLFEKDPSKLSAYTKPSGMEINSNILDNNCESGSEDNPDCLDDIQQQQGILVPITISSTNLINDDNNITENRINNVGTIGGGIKRKFDSFSSCSNDSQSGAITGDNRLNITTTIATSQEGNNNNSSIVGGDEKRLRSTNLTK